MSETDTPANSPPPAPPRRHRWLKRIALGIAGLVLLLAALVCWLLLTVAGRDVLLEQVSQRLPAGTTLQWERIDGPLAGPLSVEGLRFGMDDTRFQADRVQLEFSLLPLLGRRLQLQTLELDNAVLELPASSDETTPFTLPNWPDDILPAIPLPLSIHAEHIAIDNLLLRQGGADLLRIHGARGGIEVGDGYARVQQLVADTDRGRFGVEGHYEPHRRYRTDLTATAVFPPTGFAQAPARLGLVARGDRSHLVAALAGNAPAPLKLTVEVTGNRRPDWQLHGSTTEFDPATLGLLADRLPLAFDLQAKGHDGVTTLQGTLAQGEYRAEIAPSRLRIENDTVLHVEPLTLLLLDGRAELQGKVDLTAPEDPRFDLAIDAAGLHWGEGANAISGDATLTLTGQLKAWAAKGDAALALDKRKASIHFDGNGDDVQARLQELRVEMPGGRLDASGDIGWAQALRWKAEAKLAGFDPAFFLPGWNGAISGKLASEGQLREDGGVDASLDIPQLGGRLRGRALDGRGNFTLRGEEGEGDLQLRLGDSRITANGTVGQRLDVRAQLQPVHLADLLPDAQGSLGGHLHVGGTRTAPVIEADLAASGIDWQGYTVANASLRGRLPWSGEDGQLQLQGNGISAGVDVQRLRVELRGAVQQLQFDVDADTGYGAAAITGSAQQQRGNWSAELEKLRLAPLKGGAWQLREPTRFAQNGQAFSLTPLCLETRDNGGGALCLEADWSGEGVSLQADALPLSLLQPWLPENTGRELGLRGDLRLQAQLKPQGRSWAGEIHVASLEGGLRLGNSGQRELIRYDNLTLDATLDPQAIQARLGVGFQGDGYIDASAHTGWDDFSALQGDAYFHNASLFWMELLSPDLVRPQGVLAGHIAVAGTRGQPLMSGEATLADFRGELPSLGIELIDGQGALSALADGSARLQARFGSQSATGGKGKTAAGGNVDVEGSLSWLDGSVPLHFVVRGENFLVSDTTQLHAVASPDVIVEIGTEATRVSGKVTIPSARIDIEKLDTGVSASEDVVVLDPADPTRTPSARLDLQLAIALGEDVHLNGYGLEGGLEGTLNIRSRLGQSMAATGQLRVDGRYTAYGQKLQITEGQLDWSNSPVSDPNISLRAEREVISAGVTAGISVTGRASQPRARVWSDPELPESDALAYLVLGRSLNTASSDESQQINAAQSALSAGAGLLASQLGAKIGLDDAGVLESRTLGGSVFGVGKYLSPKLYVSYGVSMVGAGSAVTLKYLMRKGFDMEIESSTVESRGSLNWRREK